MENEKKYSESSSFLKRFETPNEENEYSESSKLIEKYQNEEEIGKKIEDKPVEKEDLHYSDSFDFVAYLKAHKLHKGLEDNPVLPVERAKPQNPDIPLEERNLPLASKFKAEKKAQEPVLKGKKKERKEFSKIADTSNLLLVIKSEGQTSNAKRRWSMAGKTLSMILTYVFLVAFAFVFLFPFYWMIITSFKGGDEIRGILPNGETGQTFWPLTFVNNYANLSQKFNFGVYMGNTLFIGLMSTIGTVITCILSAFAFSRLQFKGKEVVFAILLSTMMIPGEMMTITNYVSVSNMGWTDGSRSGAYLAMIVPFMVSIFYIYLLRQNFMQIPNELYLAAKVDGKSDWLYLWKVMVPLAMPSIITIFILKLMGTWNSYVWPNLIAGGNDSLKLISNGLRDSFQTGTNFDEYGRQMAAAVLVTVPLLLVFIIFRKYIMRGVSRAGIKG